MINWSTLSEENNDYFTLERSSDGINFESIDQIDGAGSSNKLINYQIIDKNPIKGISYYRLKQTDFDGETSYSNISSVNNNQHNNEVLKKGFILYPNPVKANENINISLIGDFINDDIILVSIIDITGRMVYNNVFKISKENKNITIPNSGSIKSGIYLLSIKGNSITLNRRLLVK